MIIEFKPKTTYFTANTAPAAISTPSFPADMTYDLDDEEREYKRAMRNYRIQNAIIIVLILLTLFAIFNIRVSVMDSDPILSSSDKSIVLFMRCLTEPNTGDTVMTGYDFTNPKFDTVGSVSENGYIRLGNTPTRINDVTIYNTVAVTDTFYTLCIIPLH